MNLRKHMVLIVAGGVALVLLAVSVFMLLRFHTGYERVDTQREATTQRLNQLYHRDPYPSDDNVLLTQTNFSVLEAYFSKLFTGLRQDQIEPAKMEPAEFPLALEKTIRKLQARAAELKVVLPPRFAFGFDHYAEGALPNAADVPRLVLQLKTIEELGGLLLQCKIGGVVSVQRTVFEQGVQTADTSASDSRRGNRRQFLQSQPTESGAPAQEQEKIDPSGLFSREHYVLTFEAHDAAIWEVLSTLSRSKMFTVVSRVEFANEAVLPNAASAERAAAAAVTPSPAASAARAGVAASPLGVNPAGGAPAAAEPKKEILSHEERVVAGRELVKAVVEVEVCRFLGEKPGEQQEAKQ